ncbi:hypothetical protein BC937DRAFT_94313, partial [Endogone sp. FLAS-F59071]
MFSYNMFSYNMFIQFPSAVRDLNGNEIDVKALAQKYQLIVITLKATWCPVCPELMKILNVWGVRDDVDVYVDRFSQAHRSVNPKSKKVCSRSIGLRQYNDGLNQLSIPAPISQFYRLLLRHDAYFICICPGPESELATIQRSIPFTTHPFVCDADLSLASKMQLKLSSGEIWPSILYINPDLFIRSIGIGRGPSNYGDAALFKHLSRQRWNMEGKGVDTVRKARQELDWLNMRVEKWERKRAGVGADLDTGNHKDDHATRDIDSNNDQLTLSDNDQLTLSTLVSSSTTTSSFNTLPPEILSQIFSSVSSVSDLIRHSRVSCMWYLGVHNALASRLRGGIARVTLLLPQCDGYAVQNPGDVEDVTLERLEDGPDCGFRVLEQRVAELVEVVKVVGKWVEV